MTDEQYAELETQATELNKKWDIEAWSRRGSPDYRFLVKQLLLEIQILREGNAVANELLGLV